MEFTKIFINDQYHGTVTCLSCGRKRILNMLKYSGRFANVGDKALKVKCQCSQVTEIICEFRKFPRVKVNLQGKLLHLVTHEALGDVTVESLSLGGIGFSLHSALAVHQGDVFELVFTLDNPGQSVLCEEIVVKRIQGNTIGVEFRDKEKYNHALDFYITNCHKHAEATLLPDAAAGVMTTPILPL